MTDRIALATAAAFPDLDEDGAALIDALARLGVQSEPVVWTDEAAAWSSYSAVVVRSTWDYFHRRDEFLLWADRRERPLSQSPPSRRGGKAILCDKRPNSLEPKGPTTRLPCLRH